MEDAATAEISRMQLWQQIKYKLIIEDQLIDINYIMNIIKTETNNTIIIDLILKELKAESPSEFLTLAAYEKLNTKISKL